jgi:hypothetical protein
MVGKAAPGVPIIVAATFGAQSDLNESCLKQIAAEFPTMGDNFFPVECSDPPYSRTLPSGDRVPYELPDGDGISRLKDALFKAAIDMRHVKQRVPKKFIELSNKLKQASDRSFSITRVGFERYARLVGIKRKNQIEAVKAKLRAWGDIYALPNGGVVLKPQKFAQVLACLITTSEEKNRCLRQLGGYLDHSDEVLGAIWADFPMSFWGVDASDPDPHPIPSHQC